MVSTIHSFCQDVIRTFPEKFLQYKASILLDEVDSIELIKLILDEEISNNKIEALTNDHDKYLYLEDIKNTI
jgi:superfamily I DNA/RNA helicase